MTTNNTGQTYNSVLPALLAMGFRFMAWVNGLGVLLAVLCALGILPTDLPPQLLKLPLAAFLCGLALAGLGLAWACAAQASHQARLAPGGRRHRLHWLPTFCSLAAYGLAMAMFVAGCWFLVNLAALVYQGEDADTSSDYEYDEALPFPQSGRTQGFYFDAGRGQVAFGRGFSDTAS